MIPEYLKDKRGNNKIFFLSVATIGGLVLGLSLSQMRRDKPLLKLFHGAGASGITSQGMDMRDSLQSLMELEMDTSSSAVSSGSGDFEIENTLPPSRLAETERGLADLRGYIKGMEEQNVSLKEKMNVLTNTIVSREKELMKISADVGELSLQLKSRQEEIASLSSAKNQLEEKIRELDSKFTLLSNAHSDLTMQLSRVQQEKASLEKEVQGLSSDLSRQTNLNTALNKTVADLNQALADKESQLQKLSDDLGKQASQNSALTRTISELNQALSDKDAQLRKEGEDLAKQNEANAGLSEQVLRLDESVKVKDAELASLKQEMQDLRAKLEEQTGLARKGRTERKALLAALREKEKRLKDLSIELELLAAQKNLER